MPSIRRHARWLLLAAALLAALGALAATLAIQQAGVPPRLLGPYIERRSSGHHPLIESAGRLASAYLLSVDRGAVSPRTEFPEWALPVALPARAPAAAKREIVVVDATQFDAALSGALPGDNITFVPGVYRFRGHALQAGRPGRADAPITVRAPQRGSVTLEFELLEGFRVSAPHWVFENLRIVGRCSDHGSCEHAFHVVGAARNTVIRDNDLVDFNAHLKINGEGGQFPDGGTVSGNRVYNTTARRTDAPVTLIDLVAASDWRIEGNLIADFVKDGGDFTSYGAFAKGAGSGNVFARNVVLCEHRLRGVPGRRVGLSFGGGGTGREACRDRRCAVEHERGLMRDNLIASCSDHGIYINRGAQTQLRHNTLVDTAGVSVRFAQSAVQAEGNLSDAAFVTRDGGLLREGDNRIASLVSSYVGMHRLRRPFVDADALDLRWRGAAPTRPARDAGAAPSDLCGGARPQDPAYGAFEDIGRCSRR